MKSALLAKTSSSSDQPALDRRESTLTTHARHMWLAAAAKSRHGSEWRWFSTVAFWISSSFIIGSLLFIVGGVSSMIGPLTGRLAAWQTRALVQYGYLAGGSYFTLGAYLGWFNVINVGVTKVALMAGPRRGFSDKACTRH